MDVFKLSPKERVDLIEALQATTHEFLLAYDDIDGAMKYQVDGCIWSPPIGMPVL